jgi:hypothetical protein
MNTNLGAYKLLRVFLREPSMQLINLLACNRFMRSQGLLSCAGALYGMGAWVPGKYLTDALVARSFGRAYSGGGSAEEVRRRVGALVGQSKCGVR